MLKLKELKEQQHSVNNNPHYTGLPDNQVNILTETLTKDFAGLEQRIPRTCRIDHPNVNVLSEFNVIIRPEEGYWSGGEFVFNAKVPPQYPHEPPLVKCHTRIWHPNIMPESGDICLSILRLGLDATGWNPARTLYEIIQGLNDLFTDLCSFDDPLNHEAANQFKESQGQFERKVKSWVRDYAQPTKRK